MRIVIASIAVLVGSLAAQCPPDPSPPPTPMGDGGAFPTGDAGGPECVMACANLAALGCKEGLAVNCVAICEKTQSTHLTDLHPVCLALAKTKDGARACRSVDCP